MSRIVLTLIAVAVGLTASSSLAADSCLAPCSKPPKNARAVSVSGMDPYVLASYPGNTLSATLAKGKKKTILYAEGVLTDGPYPAEFAPTRILALGVNVNGLPMQPSDPVNHITNEVVSPVCTAMPPTPCTVVGQWWLDMDDPANAALLGVPITVMLIGGNYYGGGGSAVDMSLRIRLEKK